MELAEKMEQEKQYQTEYSLKLQLIKEGQAKANKNRTRQLHITFHNPNTAEDTARYLAKLIITNLAEIRKVKDTVGRE